MILFAYYKDCPLKYRSLGPADFRLLALYHDSYPGTLSLRNDVL